MRQLASKETSVALVYRRPHAVPLALDTQCSEMTSTRRLAAWAVGSFEGRTERMGAAEAHRVELQRVDVRLLDQPRRAVRAAAAAPEQHHDRPQRPAPRERPALYRGRSPGAGGALPRAARAPKRVDATARANAAVDLKRVTTPKRK